MVKRWTRLGLFLLGAAGCVLAYLFLLNYPPISSRSATRGVLPVIVLAASTALLTARFLKLDGLPRATLGLDRRQAPLARFGIGFLAGSVLAAAWMGIVTAVTGATWHLSPAFSLFALLLSAAFNLFNNIGEELVYRGYLFVRLAEAWGPPLTVLITSIAFAALHLQAGIPLGSVVAAVFTSALIFGAIFARWRSLPLALGFHVATNVGQDMSGLRHSAASLLAAEYPASAANRGAIVLACIALVNLVLVAVLFTWPRRTIEGTAAQ